MSPTDNEDDPLFIALSTRLRQRIDDAFESVGRQSTESVAEQPEYEPGGFIVDNVRSNSIGAQSHIPLSDIPRALNLLDLSPDDDVMGVFKSAASGWGAQNACKDGVGRKDWRAVCAALLEGVESDEEMPGGEDVEIEADSGSDSDEYQMEEVSSDTEEDASDEYEEPGQRTTTGTRPRDVDGRGNKRQLTASQKAQCRQDFGRFFPHVLDSELDRQRITIKDIHRVADLLKEDLKADQILEMLDAFSSSPDRSMSLVDFEHMMLFTKMV